MAERAAAGTPAEGLLKDLKGTNSIAYTKTDPVSLAKILTKVAKDVPAFKFRAGWSKGASFRSRKSASSRCFLSKEELISKIMFMLNAPAQRVATALAALPRNLAVVISEAVKANKFGGGSAAPETTAAPESAPSTPGAEAAPAAPTPENT